MAASSSLQQCILCIITSLRILFPQRKYPPIIVLFYFILTLHGVNSAGILRIPLRRSDEIVNLAVFDFQRSKRSTLGEWNETSRNLNGKTGQGYYARVDIGDPKQSMNVLIDTGSSNFAVAASPHPDVSHYFNMSGSRTLKLHGAEVEVPYTQGEWRGVLGNDVVQLYVTTTATQSNTSFLSDIALITKSLVFFINGSRWQGILGLAYRDIVRPDSSVEPLFDALVRQTSVANVFTLQLCGSGGSGSTLVDGSMTVGGIDRSLYTGLLYYVPVRKEWYYEVIISDILVDGTSLNMDCKEYNFDKTIVDSGTTNLRLPTRVFNAVLDRLKRSIKIPESITEEFWSGVKLICWRKGTTPWKQFPFITISLAYSINSSLPLLMSPRQYLRYVPDELGLTADKDCYRFSITSSEYGTVLGAVFMEGFYIVFDRANKRLGFASTSCPWRSDGSLPAAIQSPQFTQIDTADCGYMRETRNQSAMNVAVYVMAAVCGVCLIPLVLLIIRWIRAHGLTIRPRNEIDDLLTETPR